MDIKIVANVPKAVYDELQDLAKNMEIKLAAYNSLISMDSQGRMLASLKKDVESFNELFAALIVSTECVQAMAGGYSPSNKLKP